MPLFKERGHPWYRNEAFLIEIFCWIEPKSKSDIWAQSNKKAMLDARLMSIQWHPQSGLVLCSYCKWLVPLNSHGYCLIPNSLTDPLAYLGNTWWLQPLTHIIYILTYLFLINLPVTFVLSEDIACKQVIGAPDAVENSPIWVNLHSCERYNLNSSVL